MPALQVVRKKRIVWKIVILRLVRVEKEKEEIENVCQSVMKGAVVIGEVAEIVREESDHDQEEVLIDHADKEAEITEIEETGEVDEKNEMIDHAVA